jgi:O-succinylbenzoic acid--CoA ligase
MTQAVPFVPTIAGLLDRPVLEAPERPALTTRSGRLSYAQLDAAVNRWARALRNRGLRAGDRIAACLGNDIEIVAAFHASMRLGAVWVGINEALAAPEKEFLLADSGASMLLCDPGTGEQVAARAGLPELREIITLAARRSAGDADEWLAAVATESATPLEQPIDPHAAAAIAYTSGTTGRPKGVVHSQYNLVVPGAHLVRTRGYGPELRKGDCFPLTVVNMMVLTTLLTAQAGGVAVIMDTLRADDIAAWVRRERVTVWNGPPAVLYTMAHDREIPAQDLVSLREVWSGSADLPETIRGAFERKFGVAIRATYGQSEAPTVIAIEPPDGPHVRGSSGVALPHLEVTIRDEDGRVLGAGDTGEICVAPRAADVSAEPPYRPMIGYWNRPAATAEALRDGVLHTGDVGILDEQANLSVTDRLSLMINRGGANVYPAEIERVVTQLPEVEACGVLGLPDERLGQRVGMLVQFVSRTAGDVASVVAHCRAELAAYKVPEYAAAVDELPRNAMNKIDRAALAAAGRTALAGAERVTRPVSR